MKTIYNLVMLSNEKVLAPNLNFLGSEDSTVRLGIPHFGGSWNKASRILSSTELDRRERKAI